MHRLQCALLAAVAAIGFTSIASAADMPVKARPMAPVGYNWTGFYLGGSLGARWATNDLTAISANGLAAIPPSTDTFRNTAFRAGVYGGYNWMFAPAWLLGIEADYAWGQATTTHNFITGVGGAVNPGDSTYSKQKWDAGVRARVGYLVMPNTLLFLSGGAAWLGTEGGATCSAATCGAAYTGTSSVTLTGWSIGGGLETAISGNWLLRGEYRYADFGTTRVNTTITGGGIAVTDNKVRTNTALVGLAYKFGN